MDKCFLLIYCQANRYFAGTDNNTVQAYTFPDGTPDGILTRFTAPVNSITLNASGSTLVAGARFVRLTDMTKAYLKGSLKHLQKVSA